MLIRQAFPFRTRRTRRKGSMGRMSNSRGTLSERRNREFSRPRDLVSSSSFWQSCPMPRWLAMTRVLALLAILGLIVGSFVTPARAGIIDSTMTTMAGDMPCCHGEAAPNCAKGCPMAIMCFVINLPTQAIPTSATQRIASREVLFPRNGAQLIGVDRSPPRKPPRI